MDKKVGVGVGVIVKKDGKILMGKRKGRHGSGSWSCPGGHLDFGETIEECAIRETLEESDLKIKNPKIVTLTNDIFKKEGKHYITIWVVADYTFGEAKLMEPEVCDEWKWCDWNKLPKPLFIPLQNLLKTNFNPFY